MPLLFWGFFYLHIKINIEKWKLYMLQLCVLMKHSCDQSHFRKQTQRQIDWKETGPGGLLYIWRIFLDIKFVFQYRSLKTRKDENHRHYINASKLIDYLHLLNSDF